MKECFNTLDKLASEFSYRNIYSIMTEYGDKIAAEYDDESGIKKRTYREYDIMITRRSGGSGGADGKFGKILYRYKIGQQPRLACCFLVCNDGGV